MSDHNERACTNCGSYLHHEDDCPKLKPEIVDMIEAEAVKLYPIHSNEIISWTKVKRNAYIAGRTHSISEAKNKDELNNKLHERLQQALNQNAKDTLEAKKDKEEIERLKGLLEQVVTRERSEVDPRWKEKVWQEFKIKNNIP